VNVTKTPVIGGILGLAAAAAAAGLVHERRVITRDRARVDPVSAALFGALPISRQLLVSSDDGVDLHVEEVGPSNAQLTVLFVHGYTLHLGSFHFQRQALQEAFGDQVRMVFYDQRSHGRSARAAAGTSSIEQLGRDLFTVIDTVVPVGPIVLVGHSMGGMTLMALADLHPELFRADPSVSKRAQRRRVGSLLMVNTSSGDLKSVTLGLPGVLARLRGPVAPMLLRRAVRNADLVEKTRALGADLAWIVTKRLSFASNDVDPAIVAFCTNMIAGTRVEVVADFYPALMAHDGRLGLMNLLECDVVVIGAEHDALTPLKHSQTIAETLPDADFIIAPNAGHLLMMEYPEVVNEPLIDLVGKALARATGSRRLSRYRARG
jgi:pimeloyl-ACP methyl ester carboxylesterase